MDRPRRRSGLIALILMACTSDDGPVLTAELRADVQIESADGITGQAWVQLADGDGPVVLPGVDQVQVAMPDWLIELVAAQGAYQAALPAAPEGVVYTMILARDAGDSAPQSVVTMPLAPVLTAPEDASRSEPLTLWWTPAGAATVALDVDGPCIEPLRVEVVDELGGWEFPAGALDGQGECDVWLTATRDATGELDPAFAGGSIVARQVRQHRFRSTP